MNKNAVPPCRCVRLYLLLFVLFVSFVVKISAQEQVSQIEIQPRFIQRLSWTADEYALRYEVEIEKQDEEGNYRRYLLEKTEESSIHISLPYGSYRFRVVPYDLFNRPGIATEYQYIEIKAPDPETKKPEKDYGKSFNFYLGACWLTQVNIHGKADWVSAPGQYLNGAALRLGLVSTGLNFFNLGGEIVPAWYSIDSLLDDERIKSLLLEGNFILQKDLFNRKAAFAIRAGGGFTYSLSDSPVEEKNETAFYANMGFSIIWQPVKHFYMEAGANYSYFFAIENPTGRIRPFVGLGTRIGSR